MPNDEIDDLARQLLRVRAIVAAEAPSSPAWAATVEWRDEIEAQLRSMGIDPDVLARTPELAGRRRKRQAPPRLTWTERYPAGAR
jgi:hypothetical protein